MKVDLFDFHLPEELIAQTPLPDRTASRLMVLDKRTGAIRHETFRNIISYLNPGDCLVLNDTRVMPARLYGEKEETGGTVEVLLLKQLDGDRWETLVKPGKRVKPGTKLTFGGGSLKPSASIRWNTAGECLSFRMTACFMKYWPNLGRCRCPRTLKKSLTTRNGIRRCTPVKLVRQRRQPPVCISPKSCLTPFAKNGVHIVFITLHVGLGTFRPVQVDEVEKHDMHAEFYQMSEETAETLNRVREQGGRIIAVGTTSTRTLETIAGKHNGRFVAESGWTDIFIYPGYEFKGIDGLVTNFHLPKSTLIMLVSALAGRENILHAYQVAVKERYRFFQLR